MLRGRASRRRCCLKSSVALSGLGGEVVELIVVRMLAQAGRRERLALEELLEIVLKDRVQLRVFGGRADALLRIARDTGT